MNAAPGIDEREKGGGPNQDFHRLHARPYQRQAGVQEYERVEGWTVVQAIGLTCLIEMSKKKEHVFSLHLGPQPTTSNAR